MSYAYNGMIPVRSRDPRTVIKEDTHYVARQGGSDVTAFPLTVLQILKQVSKYLYHLQTHYYLD